jgi:hypothetical protein
MTQLAALAPTQAMPALITAAGDKASYGVVAWLTGGVLLLRARDGGLKATVDFVRV